MAASDEGKIEVVAAQLRARIRKGDFGTNGRLPTVTQLAKEYALARATMYQILTLLRLEGLLIVKGTSYYVRYPLLRVPGSPLFDQFLREQGLTPATKNIVDPELTSAPADIATSLGIPEGAPVIHSTRLQGTTEVPFRLQENWYPVDLVEMYTTSERLIEELKQNPDLNVAGEIRKATGIALTNLRDDVSVRLPTTEEMNLLNIVRTAQVMKVSKQFLSQEDRVMVFVRSVLVGAYFFLHYDYPHIRKG